MATVWYTTTSNLGVIKKGQFYHLDARDPSNKLIDVSVRYPVNVHGIEYNNGTILVIPRKVVQGVPKFPVGDVTDTFTVRAKPDNIVNDKTFINSNWTRCSYLGN